MFKKEEEGPRANELIEYVTELMGNGQTKRYIKGRSLGKVRVRRDREGLPNAWS